MWRRAENAWPAVTVLEALEADLRAWGAPTGVLQEAARKLALALDKGATANESAVLSRELRQLVVALRGQAVEEGPSEVDRFLAGIQAEHFGGR